MLRLHEKFCYRFALGGEESRFLLGLSENERRETHVLVSLSYLDNVLKHIGNERPWASCMIDSGAFTVKNSGGVMTMDMYLQGLDKVRRLGMKDTVIVGLDVIGDWRATMKNTDELIRRGIDHMPVWHQTSPIEVLDELMGRFPLVGLGGLVGGKGIRSMAKESWALTTVAKKWPHRFHGLGVGSNRVVFGAPWHSVDSSSVGTSARRFGRWMSYGRLNVRSNHDLVPEFRLRLDMQAKARSRFARQMVECKAVIASKFPEVEWIS